MHASSCQKYSGAFLDSQPLRRNLPSHNKADSDCHSVDLYRQTEPPPPSPTLVSRERDVGSEELEIEKVVCDEDDDGLNARKKLRLTKAQSALLEESFKHHNTLNPAADSLCDWVSHWNALGQQEQENKAIKLSIARKDATSLKFLDADFMDKETQGYTALNHRTVKV